MKQQESTVFGLVAQHGGVQAGGANGERGYMLTFVIAYIRVRGYMWVIC